MELPDDLKFANRNCYDRIKTISYAPYKVPSVLRGALQKRRKQNNFSPPTFSPKIVGDGIGNVLGTLLTTANIGLYVYAYYSGYPESIVVPFLTNTASASYEIFRLTPRGKRNNPSLEDELSD